MGRRRGRRCYPARGHSPSGKGGFCDPIELPLLRLLLSLLTDRLDLSFLCTLCDTGVGGCFLGGCCVAVGADLAPGPDPPAAAAASALLLAPQEHVRVAPLLSAGGPALLWRRPFGSLPAFPSAGSEGNVWDCGWAGDGKEENIWLFSCGIHGQINDLISFFLCSISSCSHLPSRLN